MRQFAVGEVVLLWVPVVKYPSAGEWRRGVVMNFSPKGRNIYVAPEDIRRIPGKEFEYPHTLKEYEADSK